VNAPVLKRRITKEDLNAPTKAHTTYTTDTMDISAMPQPDAAEIENNFLTYLREPISLLYCPPRSLCIYIDKV
jgi:hypothetical protein